MPFILLKPKKAIPLSEKEKLRAIILCEGKDDAETLKTLTGKLCIQSRGNVGITYCEGISRIPEIAYRVARVAYISKAMKKIAIMADANDQTFEQRTQAFVDSLKDHGTDIEDTQKITESLHVAKTEKVDIPIKIAGIMDLPFSRHMIEDHAVHLLILEGRIGDEQLGKVNDAKEIIESREEIKNIIEAADEENVQEGFKNIVELLRTVAN